MSLGFQLSSSFFLCMKGMFIYVYKQKAENKQVYKQDQNDEINNINKRKTELHLYYTQDTKL